MATKDSCELKTDADNNLRWRIDPAEPAPSPLPEHLREAADFMWQDGAPPVVASTTLSLEKTPSPEKTPQTIDAFLQSVANVHPDQATHAKRDSAGWMTSVSIHALILALFYLLLAPVDLGGIDMQVLYFSFADAETVEQDEGVQVAVVEIESVPEEPATPVEEPPPAVVTPVSVVAKSDAAADGESLRDGAMPGGNAGSSGSFFGIEANGRDFVYIVDMSGSMRGRRYQRATSELVRSVEGLRETQNFYVLLFNGGTVQMFNEAKRLQPQAIAATPENKRRLANWVRYAFSGGSTDPREALHIALRMKPSAIFMLSDGEFDDQRTTKSSILKGNPNAFSIVEAAASRVPINAIAFEDPASCHNMQRLAEMTNGEYRFAKMQDNEHATRAMQLAQQATDRGDKATAIKLLREVLLLHGTSDAGWEARRKIVPMLAAEAKVATERGDVGGVQRSLMEVIAADPQGEFSWDLQSKMLDEVATPDRVAAANGMMVAIVERFPKSRMAITVIDQAAMGLLSKARLLREGGSVTQSFKCLDVVINKYSETPAAKECALEREQMIENIMSKAEQLHVGSNDASYAKLLRGLSEKFSGTHMQRVANEALEDLAVDMLSKVRDASIRRDTAARSELNRMLEEGFAGHARIDDMRQEFSRNELKARELYRRAERLERLSKDDHAQSVYTDLVEKFPATLSAGKARKRIRSLTRNAADDDDEDLSELMKMMNQ